MRDLKMIDSGREEDLVTALLHAIDLARSSRSAMTVYILQMALLNEGFQLAAELPPRRTVPATRKTHCQLPSLRSARREGARPR